MSTAYFQAYTHSHSHSHSHLPILLLLKLALKVKLYAICSQPAKNSKHINDSALYARATNANIPNDTILDCCPTRPGFLSGLALESCPAER